MRSNRYQALLRLVVELGPPLLHPLHLHIHHTLEHPQDGVARRGRCGKLQSKEQFMSLAVMQQQHTKNLCPTV
jgi:hypothetical protein